MAGRGWKVGIMARRVELLEQLRAEYPREITVAAIDLRHTQDSIERFRALADAMGGIDTVVLNAGIHLPNLHFDWKIDQEVLQVNTVGFIALANAAAVIFLKQSHGHIVGISSIAGTRGSGKSPVYSASKACVSNYLEGLRQRLLNTNIRVTDIRPGFVLTDMLQNRKHLLWAADAKTAARQITGVICSGNKVAYVTRRWRWVACFYKIIPQFLYDWIYGRYITPKLVKAAQNERSMAEKNAGEKTNESLSGKEFQDTTF